MRKNFFLTPNCSIKRAAALIIVTVMLFTALPSALSVNDSINVDDIFAVGNGIYLGSYRHAESIDTQTLTVTRENALTPILWQVISVEGPEAVLASVYVLDIAEKNYISYLNNNVFFGSDNCLFLAQEEELVKSVSVLSGTFDIGNVRAPLKNNTSATSWWLKDGYYVDAEGSLSVFPDVNDAVHGFRPTITIDLATAGQTIADATPENGTRKYDLTFTYELGEPDLIQSETKPGTDAPQYISSPPLSMREDLVTPFSGIPSENSSGSTTGGDSDDNKNKNNNKNANSGSSGSSGGATDINININAKTADYGIIVDYVDEVIRLVDMASFDGEQFVEVGDKTVSEAYKTLLEDLNIAQINNKDSVEFMYALKATPESSLSGDKKIKTLLSEKWYPMYGDTVNISNLLQKSDKKAYYIAIRRADDVFDSQSGYQSRQTVELKSRNPNAQFKKQIKYDAEREMFVLASGEAEMAILYRMNYFTTLVEATMTATEGISVPAHIYPLGGVLYISSMPIMKDNRVIMAASKPVKISVPKRAKAPAVKLDLSSKKIASLKKSSTEFSYDGRENWTTYNGAANLELVNIREHFPNIRVTEEDNYILYFRTKATAKTPASEAKKLVIPRSFVNEPANENNYDSGYDY